MTKGWLTAAGPYTIEHAPAPHPAGGVDESAPAKGVLHTTEGSLESALSVFRRHYAPTFLVGAGRIIQFMPLGDMAAALEHRAGTVATNAVSRVQIEIAGHSSTSAWLPDAKTLDTLGELLAELADVAEIPLIHAGNGTRSSVHWAHLAGWFGHSEVPGNSHWDPGALKWGPLLELAASKRDSRHPAHRPSTSSRPAGVPSKIPAWAWTWAAWRLGRGRFKGHAADPRRRPRKIPKQIPAWAWAWLAWAFRSSK